MKKEILERAKELEKQIGKYKDIAYITSYPYQMFKLFHRQAYIGAASYNQNAEITLSDKELAELIEDYCRRKIEALNKELEEM